MSRAAAKLCITLAMICVICSFHAVAAAEGIVLEYELWTPQYADNPPIDPRAEIVETHDAFRLIGRRALYEAVQRWNDAHETLQPESGQLARVQMLEATAAEKAQWAENWKAGLRNPFVHRNHLAVFLASDDTDLAASLQEALQSVPGLSQPRVHPAAGFMERRYPDLYAPLTISVDGRAYRFPEEFTADEVGVLRDYIRRGTPRDEYVINFAANLPELYERLGIGGYSRVIIGEQGITIQTLLKEPQTSISYPEFGLTSISTAAFYTREVDGEWVKEPRDPDQAFVSLTEGWSQYHQPPTPVKAVPLEGWKLFYLLYPVEMWQPGQSPQAYLKTPELDARAEALFDSYAAILADFKAEHTGLMELSPALEPVYGTRFFKKNRIESEMYEVTALVDEAVMRELKRRLDVVEGYAAAIVVRLQESNVDIATGDVVYY